MSYQPTTLNTSIPQTSPHPPYSPPSLTHSLSTMNTTATHSTTNTTNPTPTTSHTDAQQNTATGNTRNATTKDESPTTHILKTLRRYTTLTIPSISTSPRLCPPPPPPKKKKLFWRCALFFEEPLKCLYQVENIKSIILVLRMPWVEWSY